MVKESIIFIWHLPRKLAIMLVTAYQMTLSPDHGPLKNLHPFGMCRFEITCSEYAKNAFASRGFIIGIILSARRVIACNPFRGISDEKLGKLAAASLQRAEPSVKSDPARV